MEDKKTNKTITQLTTAAALCFSIATTANANPCKNSIQCTIVDSNSIQNYENGRLVQDQLSPNFNSAECASLDLYNQATIDINAGLKRLQAQCNQLGL